MECGMENKMDTGYWILDARCLMLDKLDRIYKLPQLQNNKQTNNKTTKQQNNKTTNNKRQTTNNKQQKTNNKQQ